VAGSLVNDWWINIINGAFLLFKLYVHCKCFCDVNVSSRYVLDLDLCIRSLLICLFTLHVRSGWAHGLGHVLGRRNDFCMQFTHFIRERHGLLRILL
jgi:hypothetical protein